MSRQPPQREADPFLSLQLNRSPWSAGRDCSRFSPCGRFLTQLAEGGQGIPSWCWSTGERGWVPGQQAEGSKTPRAGISPPAGGAQRVTGGRAGLLGLRVQGFGRGSSLKAGGQGWDLGATEARASLLVGRLGIGGWV